MFEHYLSNKNESTTVAQNPKFMKLSPKSQIHETKHALISQWNRRKEGMLGPRGMLVHVFEIKTWKQ